MSIFFPLISSETKVDTYKKIRAALNKHDQIIFSSMKKVYADFEEPSDKSEYESKHLEIQMSIDYIDVMGKSINIFILFEEVWKEVLRLGGITGQSNENLIEAFRFPTSTPGVFVSLTNELTWIVTTNIEMKREYSQVLSMDLGFHNPEWKETVPRYILEYFLSSITAFRLNMYSSSVALITIAVEATLRDVLAKRGYNYNSSTQKTSTFHETKAVVQAEGSAYKLTFQDSLPKTPDDFNSTFENSFPIQINIRRKLHKRPNKPDRFDFNVIAPPALLDFWSKDTIEIEANDKSIGGLGEALRIARNKERIITPAILPKDLDQVITTVRNNLIHLSGASLQQQLPDFGGLTLEEYLSDERRVYSLLTRVSRFINAQYKVSQD